MTDKFFEKNSIYVFFTFYIIITSSCGQLGKNSTETSTTFSTTSSANSGISFSNTITESDSLAYFKFPYMYQGGGVAIGDINNDGLSDIFLTGNMVDNKLYLNKGDMHFDDISNSANVQGDQRWYTGVTMADINGDGFLDIYLSVSGLYHSSRNQLYVNNGDLTFTELASDYGIDDISNSIQGTFFDYDNDRDLDLFVISYPMVPLSQGNMFYQQKIKENNHSESGHLYRNDGNGKFSDVTQEAGVQKFSLTLGLVAMDFNNDGWKDLYLSNDFNIPDYFFINDGDGTFTEVIKETTGHTSLFGMGIDASDFNNDGLMDLVQLDMSPEDYVRARMNMGTMSRQNFNEGVSMGFHYKYKQNSLQVNRGINSNGMPIFSEISRLAGISSTDWSWSAVFADYDNDGFKDIYITNGMKRDVNDGDINTGSRATSFRQFFDIKIEDYPSVPISNYMYQNQGDLTFTNRAKDWELDMENFSNGMSYGDLDNDGDLDLVVSNINQEVSLYRNESKGNSHLRVSLKGPSTNTFGLGAKVILEGNEITQTQELTLSRGFQSSMEPILHFGVGKDTIIKKLHVIWPDGKEQVLDSPSINEMIIFDYLNAHPVQSDSFHYAFTFEDITEESKIDFTHSEDIFDDYVLESMLPHNYAMMGPALAKGDINKDGLDDFFIGNASGQPGALFMQTTDSKFVEFDGPWLKDSIQEDAGAVFADFDNDGDDDLYVVSHGNKFQDTRDRLYINLGTSFKKAYSTLPSDTVAGKAITICDFDKDGLIDIFIGGRNVPGKYPFPASSLLLKNLGGIDEGLKFENVTNSLAAGLVDIGMVTDAEWIDIDGDTWVDLILSGEWMPVTIFKNEKGRLVNRTIEYGLDKSQGWWYTVKSMDVDNDGDLDIVGGNLGLNHKYQASDKLPFEVYANDFDNNGKNDIVLSYTVGGKKVPLKGLEKTSNQVPAIGKRYRTFKEFSEADLSDIYGAYVLKNSLHYQANTFAHCWFENKDNNFQTRHNLPQIAQFSSINIIEPLNYNGDEYPDLLVAGNMYQTEVETPRSDGGLGLVLIGGKDGFQHVPSGESGLLYREDVKDMVSIQLADNSIAYLFAANGEKLRLLKFENR